MVRILQRDSVGEVMCLYHDLCQVFEVERRIFVKILFPWVCVVSPHCLMAEASVSPLTRLID